MGTPRVVWEQVGASNELPESEELDALYDRFLIRREVSQVRLQASLSMPPPDSAAYPTLGGLEPTATHASRVVTRCSVFIQPGRASVVRGVPGSAWRSADGED